MANLYNKGGIINANTTVENVFDENGKSQKEINAELSSNNGNGCETNISSTFNFYEKVTNNTDDVVGCKFNTNSGALSSLCIRIVCGYCQIPKGKYAYFIKARLVADNDNWKLQKVTPYAQNQISFIDNHAELIANKMSTLYIGEIEFKDGSGLVYPINASNLRNLNNEIMAGTGTIRMEFYGSYLINVDDIEGIDRDALANQLDYSKNSTSVTPLSQNTFHAENASNAVNAINAENATNAVIASVYNTALRGKVIGVYGDSLVTYLSGQYPKMSKYLGATVKMVGQGGGQVGNNKSDTKQGFCTLERIALLPKDMSMLIIYGGANDVVGNDHTGEVTSLGSIEDEPLSIADMMNYRVTASNMSTQDTPGRSKTFYQAYKTMLRNVNMLFPQCQVICVTQHRYYLSNSSSIPVELRATAVKKVKAIREVAEEYGCPVIDFWSTSGVNNINARNMLEDWGGVAVHPNSALAEREGNLMLNGILQYADKFQIQNFSTKNTCEEYVEMQQWVVDLRSETEENVMTISQAASAFVNHCSENNITIKKNMYLVFYESQGNYNSSVGYHLINESDPSNESSWYKWVIQSIIDPNEPTV